MVAGKVSLIDIILVWADDHPEFDTSFVDSCKKQLDSKGTLSVKQMAALENIITKFEMEEYLGENY